LCGRRLQNEIRQDHAKAGVMGHAIGLGVERACQRGESGVVRIEILCCLKWVPRSEEFR
jgi:hypothetical protein